LKKEKVSVITQVPWICPCDVPESDSNVAVGQDLLKYGVKSNRSPNINESLQND
jgi:hypothetical protein